jgi:hypothetical protein
MYVCILDAGGQVLVHRDLLRRRLHLVRKRGQLLAHIQNTRAQYQLPEFGRRRAYPANRTGVSEHFPDPIVRRSIDVDLALLERSDGLITDLGKRPSFSCAMPPGPRPCCERSRRSPGGQGVVSILAHKIGRAVFYMLARRTVFSLEKFRAA